MPCSNFCACDQCSNREDGPTVEMEPTANAHHDVNGDDNGQNDELHYDSGSCSDSDISDSAD